MKKATLQENLKPCTKKTSGAKQGRKVEAERKGEVEGEKRKREEEVLVSPSSVVTELCYASPCCSDWEFVEPQSLSLSKKRAHCGTDTQEEMRYEGSPVKAPPIFKKKNDTAYTHAKFLGLLCEGSYHQGTCMSANYQCLDQQEKPTLKLGGGVVQMGQIQKSTMKTRFVGLCRRWMVASKLGTASGTYDRRLEPR